MVTTRSQGPDGLVPMDDPVAIERAARAAALAKEMNRSYRKIPTELWDDILSQVIIASGTPGPTDDFKPPQALRDLRLASSFFWSKAESAALRKPFVSLNLELDARFPAPGVVPGKLDRLATILSAPSVDSCASIRMITFSEGSNAAPMSQADLAQMARILTWLLNAATNLEHIAFTLNGPGSPINRLVRLLTVLPAVAKHFTFYGGTYSAIEVQALFRHYDGVIERLEMQDCYFPGANLENLVTILRDSSSLRQVSFSRLKTALPTATQTPSDVPCYVSNTPAIVKAVRVNLTIPPYSTAAPGTVLPNGTPQIQYYSITPKSGPTTMTGRYGVQMGLNKVLQLQGSVKYDPNLSIEARKRTGVLL